MLPEITEKYFRPTVKEHGHTKFYCNGKYIGYCMKDFAYGCGYVFDSRCNVKTFHASSKRIIKSKLIDLLT